MIPAVLLRRRPVLLHVLTRLRPAVVLLAAVGTVLGILLRDSVLHVPFLPADVTVRAAPLLPFLVSTPLVAATANPMPGLERAAAAPRRLAAARLVLVVVLTAVAGTLTVVGAAGTGGVAVAVRNSCCYLGLGYLAAVLLGADLAWFPGVVVLTALVYFGKDPGTDLPRAWALPLLPWTSAPALLGSVTALVLGGGALVARGPAAGSREG